MDPRVKATTAALQQQFQLTTRLSSLLSDGSKAVMQANSVQEQLQKLQASGSAADAVKAFQKKVTGLLEGGEAATGPALGEANDNVYALYNTVGQVDAGPTAAQVSAADSLAKALPGLLGQWQSMMTKDLPALNQQLKGAGLPEVNPETPLSHESQGMDEE